MKMNYELECLIGERAAIAENDYEIISYKDCFSCDVYFPLFEEMVSDTEDIEKLKQEVDEVFARIFELDTQKLNDKESSFRRDIPLRFQTDKKITIEMYDRYGDSCFYGDYLVNADDEQEKVLTIKDMSGLVYAMAVIEEENHNIIDAERTCKRFTFFNSNSEKYNGLLDFSENRKRIMKYFQKNNEMDRQVLNDKEGFFRHNIPLDLQTNKEITIEEYHKNGERCFYKNIEDYPEM